MSTKKRNSGTLDAQMIATKTLIILGGGSVGSKVIGDLHYNFRQLVIIDDDKLEGGSSPGESNNVERHLLGHESVGQYKVTALKRWLVRSKGCDPSRITTHRSKAERVLDRYRHADLIIEATGSTQLRRNLCGWSQLHSKPVIYAGIHPRGTGGEIIVIANPAQSCWRCYEASTGEIDNGDVALHNYGINPGIRDKTTGELGHVPYLSGPVSILAGYVQHYALDLMYGIPMQNQWLEIGLKSQQVCVWPGGQAKRSLTMWQNTQTQLGLMPTTSLREIEGKGLTLELSLGNIPGNIQPHAGCPHHFRAALQLEKE